jgi:oligoendopeptidase F
MNNKFKKPKANIENNLNNNKQTIENKPKITNFSSPKQDQSDYNELQFNVNDDYKTLVKKNTKLRNLLVKASNKINELVIFQI